MENPAKAEISAEFPSQSASSAFRAALGWLDGRDLDTTRLTWSPILGVSAPADRLVELYEEQLAGGAAPFDDAVARWQAATGLSEDADVLAEQLGRARELPLELQRAAAVLLLALTDATLLQSEAIRSLTDDDVRFLHRHFDTLDGFLDEPEDSSENIERAERVDALTSLIHMERIAEGARLLLAAYSKSEPVLESVSEAFMAAHQRGEQVRTKADAFYERYPPSVVANLSATERVHVIADYLRMTGSIAGLRLPPDIPPLRLGPDARLSDSIRALAAILGVPTSAPEVATELAAADALPVGLQRALGALVLSQADMVRQVLEPTPKGTAVSDPAAFVAAAIGFLATLEDALPTLTAYHYLYQLNAPVFPKNAADVPDGVAGTLRLAAAASDPRTSLAEVLSIAGYLQGIRVSPPARTPESDPGSLGRAIASQLALSGMPATNEERRDWEAATAMLPRELEQAAAGILSAEVAYKTDVASFFAGLSEDQRRGLEDTRPVVELLENEWLTHADIEQIEPVLQAVLDLRKLILEHAARIAQAIDDARELVVPLTWPTSPSSTQAQEVPGAPSAPNADPPGPAAPVQAPTVPAASIACNPTVPSSNCDLDVLFLGPQQSVVITGTRGMVYHPGLVGGREHVLWIDLGGDDTYFVGAGGASVQRVSVMLELGGNDQYLTSPEFANFPYQGAASGIGFMGMLVDVGGSDRYRVEGGLGQGAALGLGLGVLLDESGNDVRNITGPASVGQAFAGPADVSRIGGMGVLVDREAGAEPGRDTYRIVSGHPSPGQASVSLAPTDDIRTSSFLGGFALFVDATGFDTYRGGGQSKVETSVIPLGTSGSSVLRGAPAGLSIFADVQGIDAYARNPAAGPNRKNNQCESGAAARIDGTSSSVPFVDESDPGSLPTGIDLREGGLSGDFVSIFLDLDDDACQLRNPVEVIPPQGFDPGAVLAEVDRILAEIQEGEPLGDDDVDAWPNFFEALLGTDGSKSAEYPAGLPAKPSRWPPDAPYPPEAVGQPKPFGSPFLVQIPSLFAVGDAASTDWLRDHQFSLDLGGPDEYRNRVGSNLQAIHIDLGDETDAEDKDDLYVGGDRVQAYWGFLFDLGGNDTYLAGRESQGSSPSSVLTPFGAQTPPAISILADFRGDDEYFAGPFSQAYADPGDVTVRPHLPQKVGVLVDFAGNDTYATPTQAIALVGRLPTGVSNFVVAPALVHAGLTDWGGVDHYTTDAQATQPVAAARSGLPTNFTNLYWSHFADLGGWDTYRTFAGAFDLSRLRNERYDASAVAAPTLGLGPSSVSARTKLDANSGSAFEADRPEDLSGEDPDRFHVRLPGLRLAIGKDGPTTYRAPYALTLDLGGADQHLNNAGATIFSPVWVGGARGLAPSSSGPVDPPRILAGLLVDLSSGNDTYDDRDWRHPEAGFPAHDPGPRLVFPSGLTSVDVEARSAVARPENQNRLVTQGAGFLGVGFLIDASGDETYTAHRYSQGAGVAGIGVVWDRGGDDDYGYAGNVHEAPALSSGRLVWTDFRNGRPEVYTRSAAGTQSLLTPPPKPADGWRGDHAQAVHEGRLTVWASRFDEQWDLYRSIDLGSPSLLVGGFSNQTSPRLSQGTVAFVDDRDGVSQVFVVEDADTASPTPPLVVAATNRYQAQPDIFREGLEFRVVWVEFASDGTWQVWQKNVAAGLAPQRVSLVGVNAAHPRVHGSWVTWQQWSPVNQSWDVFATDLDNPVSGTVAVDFGAGNQTEPDVNSLGVAYVDESSGELRMWYRAGEGPCPTLLQSPDGFSGPAFDVEKPADVAVVRHKQLASGQTGFSDIVVVSASTCVSSVLVNGFLNGGPQFLQGVAAEHGVGILLDEGGDEHYGSSDFSQGASYTSTYSTQNAPPPAAVGPPGVPQDSTRVANIQGNLTEQRTRAFLIDLDGRDRYEAKGYSQGSHGSGIFVHQVGPYRLPGGAPNPIQGTPGDQNLGTFYMADNQGILYDVTGDDHYGAASRSQGYAGLTVGLVGARLEAAAPPSLPNVLPDASPFLVNSLGLFLDTGGTDTHEYSGGDFVVDRLWGQLGVEPCRFHMPEATVTPPPPSPLMLPPISLEDEVCRDRDPGGEDLPVDEVDDVIDLLNDAVAAPRDAFELLFPPDPPGAPGTPSYNNKVWRQNSMSAPPAAFVVGVLPGFVGSANDLGGRNGVLLGPGGVGLDLSAYEHYAALFQAAIGDLVSVSILANGAPIGDTSIAVDQIVELSVQVTRPEPLTALELRAVEYTASGTFGSQLIGKGRSSGCGYCVTWSTNDGAWPDAGYAVTANLAFALAPFGFSVGHVTETRSVLVDNVPLLRPTEFPNGARGVDPSAFSPTPHVASGRPSQAEFNITVSRNVDGTSGALTIDIVSAESQATLNGPPLVRLFDGMIPSSGREVTWNGFWNGRLAGGVPAPTGDYSLRAFATDDPSDPARGRTLLIPFRIDRELPGTTCVRPTKLPGFPCNGEGFIPELATESRVLDTVKLTIGWTPSSSKPEALMGRFHVFVCRPETSDPCTPDEWDLETLPAEARRTTVSDLKSGDRVHMAALAEDVYGNLEDGSPNTIPLSDALQAKLDRGEYVRLRLDLEPPAVTTKVVVAGREVAPAFVGPDSDASVVATVRDDLSPVEARLTYVSANLDVANVPVQKVEAPTGETVFTGTPFRDLSAVREWPGGPISFILEVTDDAGNVRRRTGTLLLDRDAPEVLPATHVEYPAGRNYVTSGDKLVPNVFVQDFPRPPNTIGSRAEKLNVTLDASAIEPGLSEVFVSTFRRTVLKEFFTTSVDVSAAPPYAQVVPLPLTVRDEAGNAASSTLEAQYGKPQFELSALDVVARSHVRLFVRWTTANESLGLLEWGTDSRLGHSVPSNLSTPGRYHEAVLDSLSPATTYFLRASAYNESGVVEIGAIWTATTTAGLSADPIAPVGTPNSFNGPIVLRWNAALAADPDEELEYNVTIRPQGLETSFLLHEFSGPQGLQEFSFDSAEFTDGHYDVTVGVRSETEQATISFADLVIDRRKPQILPVSPAPGTSLSEAPSVVRAALVEGLSGIDLATLTLGINEVEATGEASLDESGKLSVAVVAPFRPGLNVIALGVRDRAGNPGLATWQFVLDGSPPMVEAQAHLPSNQTAVKAGDEVRVSANVSDESAVPKVWVETAGLSSVATLFLEPVSGDRFEGRFVVDMEPQGLSGGREPLVLRVWAKDAHGRQSLEASTVPIVLDRSPPRLERLGASVSEPSRISLTLGASEPSRFIVEPLAASVRAASPDPIAPLQTEGSAELAFSGAVPRLVPLAIQLIDEAGHITRALRDLDLSAMDKLPPLPPGRPDASPLPDGRVLLSWTPSTDDVGVAKYEVFRAQGSSGFARIASPESASYTDQPPSPGVATYFVVAVDASGKESEASQVRGVQPFFAPVLREGAVSPPLGSQSTEFVFRVIHVHGGGEAPTWVRVVIDGVPNAMAPRSRGSCEVGCVFEFGTALPVVTARKGNVEYYFEASASERPTRFPEVTGALAGPIVVKDAVEGERGAILAGPGGTAPAGGFASMVVILVTCTALLARAPRRRPGSDEGGRVNLQCFERRGLRGVGNQMDVDASVQNYAIRPPCIRTIHIE